MQGIDTIKRILSEPVISSGLLVRDLVAARPPATSDGVATLEQRLPRRLSEFHRQLLLTWNGLDLDVVRFFGASPVRDDGTSLLDAQSLVPAGHPDWVALASDPAGFLYVEDEHGVIWSIDHDGGEVARAASSLDEFICSYIFGTRAAEFGGDSWRDDLVTYGVLPAA
ncbi:MAG: SMI1/KNR4 family protein [Verrucomicrobiota bacterium]